MNNGNQDDLETIVADYLNRLNRGEAIDPLEVLAKHPENGQDILDELEAFIGLEAEPEPNSLTGTIGDYTLRRQIGRGGMGIVYEAWENSMDRAVALKVLPAGIAADDRSLHRFVREAKTAGKLSHPHIVSVYGMGLKEETPYYSMEYVEGETLMQIIAKTVETEPNAATVFGKKDELAFYSNVASAFADVADGLQHAHSKGVVHRDIKPSNLIVDAEGRLRILDFGLARLDGQESLTLTGDFLGTPLYMSPEQARRQKTPVDHRTDVYSLGATLYEMLVGRPTFRGKDHADTLTQIIEREPLEPRKVNPRVPKDLETIVLKCLRKDTSDRYGTAEALAQDLRRFVRGDPIEARPPGRWVSVARWTRRRRWHLAFAACLVISALLGTTVLLKRQEEEEARVLAEYERRLEALVGQLEVERMNITAERGTERVIDPHGTFVLLNLEQVVAGRPSVEKIVAELRELENLVPRLPDASFHRARALLLLKRPDTARVALAQALERDGRFQPALALASRVLPESSGELETVLPAIADDSLASAWSQAHAAQNVQDWSRAEEAWSKLIKAQRSRGELFVGAALEARLARGHVRLRLRDRRGAIEDFAFAKEAWPQLVGAYVLLAKTYQTEGHSETARRTLEQLYDNAADKMVAGIWCGLVCDYFRQWEQGLFWARRVGDPRFEHYFLYQSGKLDRALELARSVIADRSEDPIGHIMLAHCHLKLAIDNGGTTLGKKHFDATRNAVHRALELDPGGSRASHAWGILGRLLLMQGKRDQAATAFQKLFQARPHCVGARQLTGSHYYSERLFSESERAYRAALELSPFAPAAVFSLSAILREYGRFKEGADLARELVAKDLDMDGRVHWELAFAMDALGDSTSAAIHYLKATELESAWRYTYRRLAWSLLKVDWPSAPAELDNLLQVLEEHLVKEGGGGGMFNAVALWRLLSTRHRDLERAHEHAKVAVSKRPHALFEETLGRVLRATGDDAGAVRAIEAALPLWHASPETAALLEEYRKAVLPFVPSCASVDALLPGELASLQAPPDTPAVARYLEARRLELAGDLEEAIRTLSEFSQDEALPVEIPLRLAECHVARGAPREALRILERVIASGDAESRPLWERWTALALSTLSPAEALECERLFGKDSQVTGAQQAQTAWLLSRLRDGEDVAIDCGTFEEPAECDGGWGPDGFFDDGGKAKVSFREIAETDCETVYRSQRTFRPGLLHSSYHIPLPRGKYRLRLHFAETELWERGKRRFDVRVEGELVLEDFDPAHRGISRATVEKRETRVMDGVLDIQFLPKLGYATVAGIQIEPVAP